MLESTPFSDFIRNATYDTKRSVYEEVMRKVAKEQADTLYRFAQLMAGRHEREGI